MRDPVLPQHRTSPGRLALVVSAALGGSGVGAVQGGSTVSASDYMGDDDNGMCLGCGQPISVYTPTCRVCLAAAANLGDWAGAGLDPAVAESRIRAALAEEPNPCCTLAEDDPDHDQQACMAEQAEDAAEAKAERQREERDG